VAAALAQFSGSLVIFLGIFGFGLFASTLVPALAIGLNWPGATRAGALASISVGLLVTLVGETLAYFRVYTFPVGVSIAGLSLVLSFISFFVVSWLTRAGAEEGLDPDVKLVMEI
jgi:Na+(H+)/acetate symporter ActP